MGAYKARLKVSLIHPAVLGAWFQHRAQPPPLSELRPCLKNACHIVRPSWWTNKRWYYIHIFHDDTCVYICGKVYGMINQGIRLRFFGQKEDRLRMFSTRRHISKSLSWTVDPMGLVSPCWTLRLGLGQRQVRFPEGKSRKDRNGFVSFEVFRSCHSERIVIPCYSLLFHLFHVIPLCLRLLELELLICLPTTSMLQDRHTCIHHMHTSVHAKGSKGRAMLDRQ